MDTRHKMDTKRICTVCGKPLAPGAPEGLCPECLLKAGLGTGVNIGADTGKAPRFVPPKVEELAAKFPQLEILEFIGQGGMGAVYKTRQKQLDRIVALKILPPQAAAGAGFAERFTREARALARLNHPHIVTLYEFGQADGLFYFLMEFVDGVNLRQLLNTSRIAPREALAIVPQICEALQFAHDTGIVHRDIKPENILLDKKGQVKIADFGVAKLVTQGMEETASEKTASSDDLTEAGSSLGTPQYMAPEQIKNSAEVDHRADIYSLGVVFYQMLTGELPSGKIEPPSHKVHIDVRLDEVVLRALEKTPELRYQQASDVKTIVETIATTPASSPQPSPQPSPPGPSKTEIPDRWFAFIKIPFVTLRDGKPVTSWPVVLTIGVFLEFLALFGPILGAAIGMPNVLETRPIVLMVLPIMILTPLWLYYEIRAGHKAIAQGLPPVPLLSRRKKLVHRIVGCLLAVLFIAFYLRTLVIAPYRVETDSAAPEIPRGSQFLVWKLARNFSPGDLVAYKAGKYVFIGRVTHVENDTLQVNKNGWPDTTILRSIVVGKVISIYWRGETPAPPAPADLANYPQKLQNLPVDEVFQAGLANPQIPWAWMELKNRAASGQMDAAEAQKLITELSTWMHHNYPNGYDQPLYSLGDFLEEMRKHNLLTDTNKLVLLLAYSGEPWCDPLPRVREGDSNLSLTCHVSSLWNGGLFGLKMLNEVRSVRVDNQPVSIRSMFPQSWNQLQYYANLPLPPLAPGSHTVQYDVESAYADESDLTGLDQSARSMDWPSDAYVKWTRSCQATFTVYSNNATMVIPSQDPALNPASNGAITVKWVVIRHIQGQLKATADFRANPKPSLPVSVDATLRIGGQSIKFASPLEGWFLDDKGTLGAGGNYVLFADVDPLDPQVREADIVLEPDFQAIQSAPHVDHIWGSEIVIPRVPVKRFDLHEDGRNTNQSSTQSIRQRFEPVTGMADKTSWGVENHSEFNPDGWAVLANMTLGGVARITPGMLNGKTEAPAGQSPDNDVCRIKLVDGNDDQVTLDVDDLKWNKRITVKLNRDQWADLTVNGINYKIGYCSVWVAPDKPDTSPFANIVVTHSETQH